MRYAIALLVAGVLIAAVAAYGYSLHRAVIAELRSRANELPADDPVVQEFKSQLDRGEFPTDWASEVTPAMFWKIVLKDTLSNFWPVWGSLIVAVCLGTAWLTSGPAGPEKP